MASRAQQHAVTVTPKQGEPILIIFREQGAASAFLTTINDGTDAAARAEGSVQELPLIATGQDEETDIYLEKAFRTSFERLCPNGRLLELRDVKQGGDALGNFFTATAVWVAADPEQTATASTVRVLDEHPS